MSPGSENKIRRILIGMDPGSDHKSLLNTAREIAEAVNAELYGHFVEESSLLNLSSLPFARSIIQGGTKSYNLNPDDMQKAIRLQARRFENAISTLKMETNLTCSMRISSGDFLTEIQSSASDQDLLIIQGTPSGFTISSMMNDIRGMDTGSHVLAICPGKLQLRRGPVVILDEGDRNTELQVAFDLANSLSQSHGVPVILFQLGHSQGFSDKVYRDLDQKYEHIKIVSLKEWNTEILADILRQYHPGYIIGRLSAQLFKNDSLARIILRSIRAPLILFR